MVTQLFHGDCLTVLKDIPEHSVDLILSDLPYGVTQCPWDIKIDLIDLWVNYKKVLKENGVVLLTATQPFTSELIMSNRAMFKYTLVWIKNKSTGFLNARKQPLRQTEDVIVFYKKNPTYNPQKTQGHKPVKSFTKHTSDGITLGETTRGVSGGGQTDRYPTNVLRFPVVNNDNSKHDKFIPTQKPVPLFEYLVKTYTNPGDVVLDSCAGSGTTGIACLNLNRDVILIEKDPNYFSILKTRLETYTKR